MRRNSLSEIALTLCVALALFGCGRATKSNENARYYETRGIVRGFSPDRATIEIQHENIPGFMPSMTMPFSARDRKEIGDLKTGDAISFRLTVTEKDFWIDQVKKVAGTDVHLAEPTPTPAISQDQSPRLREGDTMPSFSLTDQNGKSITLDTFRGQPFVLTFVFTRCPIPNFCPRMSHNFSDLQSAIKTYLGALAKTRLLSITLDPKFDTPEILKQYGEHENADPKIWTFATGAPAEIEPLTHAFSVYVQTEGGTISHGLATALVAPDGTILKIWRGNAWTPKEVVAEIRAHKF
jgi:protein SCO1